jgi:hypothetical protein
METLDRARMCEAIFPVLLDIKSTGRMNDAELDAVIASCAEGYAFPTNLDRDPPIGGLAPKSQQALLRQALDEAWSADAFEKALKDNAWRRST